MGLRIELHGILCDIMSEFVDDPADHVSFQPPESIKLSYPCIVYRLSSIDYDHGDNLVYNATNKYIVTVIDRNPDTEIPYRIKKIPMCSPGSFFVSDNLNHYPFTIYF